MIRRIGLIAAAVFALTSASALVSGAQAFSGTFCYSDPAPNHSINSRILLCDQALQPGQILRQLSPEQRAKLLYSRGLLYQLEGQNDLAVADFTSAIGWISDFSDAYEARGDAYEDAGQHDKAIADYAQAARLTPDGPGSLNGRCWVRAVRGHPLDRALADCSEALRQNPNSWNILDTRCLVYFRMGNYAAAIADCDAAVQQKPKLESAIYVRGVAKLHAGDAAGGNADIEAAKAIDYRTADYYALYGVKP
jgi:tetratricopeptide (TPR) repeat protein